jgi:homocysteine S-methyltransferase
MDFLAEFEKRVILGDGAYGTEFLSRGCIPGSPLDELNLTRPHFVLDLHREYVAAGAELIKTNTFQANRLRLPERLRDKMREINLAGVRLAREASRGGFVAGSIGPLADFHTEERSVAYREQCRALAEGGCDMLLLETFMDVSDLIDAAIAAEDTGLPVVRQMATIKTREDVEWIRRTCTITGVNCIGLDQALTVFEHHGSLQSAFPSVPPGETLTPENFAEGIRKLIDAGARLVGGCCGIGPEHIRAAAKVVGRPVR